MVKCDVLWNRYQGYYDDSPWRGKIEKEGGALFTQASHFIDILIITFVSAIVGIIYGYSELTGQLYLYIIFAPWIYEAGMTSSKIKGTIGKRIVNIKVLNGHGEQLTFGSATARYWLKTLLWLVTLGIITIPSLIRKDKKTG
jgi:uncharacterized RDD family membrane protein YckC